MSSLVVTDVAGRTSTWSPDESPPAADPAQVRLSLPDRPDVSVDVFGVPPEGLDRKVPVRTGLVFVLDLVAPDCPLGAAFTRLHVGGDGHLSSRPLTVGSPDAQGPAEGIDHDPMLIAAPYAMLLRWLHRDHVFGHLVHAGVEIHGDLLDYAALDGIVSAPAVPSPGSPVVDVLVDPRFSG